MKKFNNLFSMTVLLISILLSGNVQALDKTREPQNQSLKKSCTDIGWGYKTCGCTHNGNTKKSQRCTNWLAKKCGVSSDGLINGNCSGQDGKTSVCTC